ncbi:ketoreductase domain-containing protein, partial [Streptomyces diastatochromogenes]|uniref:ketoreductase domain-containing protein n=1 Tax=Streptomyces diastatochromogenes TaxID=42236 RepID=UPI001FCA3653
GDELPLRGVVHCAGILDDGVVAELTPERLARVLRPKVDGALQLHRLTADTPLDLFLLVSSAAGGGRVGRGRRWRPRSCPGPRCPRHRR